jgi:ABC-type sugar transport system ATPase subunit
MVEQLGADTLIHISHGPDTVIARLPHGAHPGIGETFSVNADPARVFLFDPATGARLR